MQDLIGGEGSGRGGRGAGMRDGLLGGAGGENLCKKGDRLERL